MQQRKLGYTDLNLTTIGFGAWAIGGPWDFGWGPQDDDESIATIQAGLDAGINWIDTAPAYGLGHSEEVVGRAIKGRRDGVILATKCGLVWNDPSERSVFNRLKAASVREEAEGSLRRLGVDVIDLYQIHWPNPDADVEEAWTEIARMIEEGKIRYAGASNFSISQMRRAQAIHPVASLQPPYSLLDQSGRSRAAAVLRRERHRGRRLQPDGVRPADRQVHARAHRRAAGRRCAPQERSLPRSGAGPQPGVDRGAAPHRRAARADRGPARDRLDAAPPRAHRGHRRRAPARPGRGDRAGRDWTLSEAEIAEIDGLLAARAKQLG